MAFEIVLILYSTFLFNNCLEPLSKNMIDFSLPAVMEVSSLPEEATVVRR